MPLNLFYTMVQKSQKWPKTQIKGGPALKYTVITRSAWLGATVTGSNPAAFGLSLFSKHYDESKISDVMFVFKDR